MWILRLNMADRTYRLEEAPAAYTRLGGRGMTSTLVYDEVDPQCHPLGPNNKLVFAPGIVTGTTAPSSARISAGAKSPLTGGIKESNAGTSWAQHLAAMRIKALVVEGQPAEQGHYWLAYLTWDVPAARPKVEFFPADEYAGRDLYQVFPEVYKRFGAKVAVAACGLAAEHGYGNAGIAFNDRKDAPTRYSGRGGLGAVMASKGLKFIVSDNAGAPGVEVANKALFDQGRKKLAEAIREHAITKPQGGLNSYGTAVLINILNEAGGLPTRNFSSGRFEGAARIAGESIFEGNKQRLGKELYNHACSPGCIIQCSNTWHAADGSEIASCIEYESDWALGANLGIDSLDDIAEMVRLCNAYGLDTIETGATLGVAMQAGVVAFGDAKGAIGLIHEMGRGTPMGRILGGEGAARSVSANLSYWYAWDFMTRAFAVMPGARWWPMSEGGNVYLKYPDKWEMAKHMVHTGIAIPAVVALGAYGNSCAATNCVLTANETPSPTEDSRISGDNNVLIRPSS